jgi:hypothetical protein
MRYLKKPGQTPLFEAEDPWIDYLVQSTVSKDFDEGLVICHNKVIAALGKVPSMLQAPSNV